MLSEILENTHDNSKNTENKCMHAMQENSVQIYEYISRKLFFVSMKI